MIHHVSLELAPGDVDGDIAFWELLGFAEVTPPEVLAERGRWVERDGVQIHLVYAETPVIPADGHVAVAIGDYDDALVRLRAAGFLAAPRAEHFGSPRTQVRTPGGHLVEVMAPPPVAQFLTSS